MYYIGKNIFEYGYFLFYKGSINTFMPSLELGKTKNIRIGERYCWLLVFGSREKNLMKDGEVKLQPVATPLTVIEGAEATMVKMKIVGTGAFMNIFTSCPGNLETDVQKNTELKILYKKLPS
ncbi:hypothetical protein ACJX0J_037512 [Zea mays]